MHAGWRVALVWECRIREAGAGTVAAELADWIRSDSAYISLPACPNSRTFVKYFENVDK